MPPLSKYQRVSKDPSYIEKKMVCSRHAHRNIQDSLYVCVTLLEILCGYYEKGTPMVVLWPRGLLWLLWWELDGD